MTAVVFDASLAVTLVVADEDSAAAEQLLRQSSRRGLELLTAAHWALEVANGLLQASRRGRLSAGDRLIGFEFLMGLPISVIPDAAPAALFRLADEDRLSIYDSAYLALALERRAQLATADKRLAEVARKRGILWGVRSKA